MLKLPNPSQSSFAAALVFVSLRNRLGALHRKSVDLSITSSAFFDIVSWLYEQKGQRGSV
jgi:hypothetical protein